ncbi:hypothetical protein RSAG8_02657, partial [Rhizoctonia solani AG-8 WAC10335]
MARCPRMGLNVNPNMAHLKNPSQILRVFQILIES